MIYDFRLCFSGLCFFYRPESGSRPVDVLLVKATDPQADPDLKQLNPALRPHAHKPRLVVDPKYLDTARSRMADGLCVGPDGADYPLFEIEGEDLAVFIPGVSTLDVPKGRRPINKGPFETPGETGAHPDWFDWAISVPHVSKTTTGEVLELKTECWGDLSAPLCPVISRVQLTGGKLTSLDHSRVEDNYMVHYFAAIDHGLSDEQQHVFADRITLGVDGISTSDAVEIRTGPKGTVYLKPSAKDPKKRVVTASITNFDAVFQPSRSRILDFLWYYTLYNWNGSKPNVVSWPIPVPRGMPTGFYTPSTTTCPPGSG